MSVRGRSAARRAKRTSVGIWSLDDVSLKMFGGRKYGRVLRKKKTAEMKRMFREGLM